MRTAGWFIVLLGFAAGLATMVAAPAARADEAAFTVTIVKATSDGESMDQALARFANLLSNRGYTNFTKVGTVAFALAEKQTKKFGVSGNVSAEIEYQNEVNNRIAFSCRVFEGRKKALEVNYSIARGGKTMVIFRGKVAYMLVIEVR